MQVIPRRGQDCYLSSYRIGSMVVGTSGLEVWRAVSKLRSGELPLLMDICVFVMESYLLMDVFAVNDYALQKQNTSLL